jgi:hypothetical protein
VARTALDYQWWGGGHWDTVTASPGGASPLFLPHRSVPVGRSNVRAIFPISHCSGNH